MNCAAELETLSPDELRSELLRLQGRQLQLETEIVGLRRSTESLKGDWDIAQKKQVEDARRENQRFDQLAEQHGMVVWEVDPR